MPSDHLDEGKIPLCSCRRVACPVAMDLYLKIFLRYIGFGGTPLPFSASLSASSFPLMIMWLGTHSMIIFLHCKYPLHNGKHRGKEVDVISLRGAWARVPIIAKASFCLEQ